MALPQDTKTIPQLTLGTTPLSGNELLEMEQAGASVKIAANAFPPIGAAYITLANNGFLTGSRTLVAGAGVSLTDGGAGSTVTISLNGAGGTGFGAGWDWFADATSLTFVSPGGTQWGVMGDVGGTGRTNVTWIASDPGGTGNSVTLAMAGLDGIIDIEASGNIVLNSSGGGITTNTNMLFDAAGGFTTQIFPGTISVQEPGPGTGATIEPGQVLAVDNTDATNAVQFIGNNQSTGTSAITQQWLTNDAGTTLYTGVTGSNFAASLWTDGPTGVQAFVMVSNEVSLSIGAAATEYIRIDPNTHDLTLRGHGVIVNYSTGDGFTVSYTGGGGPTASFSMNEIGGADFNLSGDFTIEADIANLTLASGLQLAGDAGTAGDVLTSGGPGAPPIWANSIGPTGVQTTVLAAGNTSNLALSAGSKGFLDLNPTGGASTLTGIAAQFDGQILIVSNIHATNSVTLSSLNGLSTAANQFRLPADITILQWGEVTLRYSNTIGKWVPMS